MSDKDVADDADDPNDPNVPNVPNVEDIAHLNDVIHGRLRLGVMAYLSTVSPASFPELVKKIGASNGNLSTHLAKLENAGYVRQEKGFHGKRPRTLVHLTSKGRSAWIEYLEAMQRILAT